MRDMLEKLSVQSLFPMSIIKASKDKITSIQRQENSIAVREAIFNKNYFDEIEITEDKVIELEIQKALNIIKKLPSNVDLTFKLKDDKVVISSKRVHINLSYRDPKEDDIIDKMPYTVKEDGTPVIKGIELSTHINMKLSELKETTDYGSPLGTEYYTFIAEKNKLNIRVGDLHKFSDSVLFETEAKVDGEAEAIYTKGLTHVANTFLMNNFEMHFANDAPALIYEQDKESYLALLLPPQPKSKE